MVSLIFTLLTTTLKQAFAKNINLNTFISNNAVTLLNVVTSFKNIKFMSTKIKFSISNTFLAVSFHQFVTKVIEDHSCDLKWQKEVTMWSMLEYWHMHTWFSHLPGCLDASDRGRTYNIM